MKILSFILLFAAASTPPFALARQSVSDSLSSSGYDPARMEKKGAALCQESSQETFLREAETQNDELSARLKREQLVFAAIGFAEYFSHQMGRIRADQFLGKPGSCGMGLGFSDCTGTDNLIRRLAKIGPDEDWCSAFVATLTEMVDEQTNSGPKNLMTSRSGAASYASAAKLLAVFDPHVSINSIAWPGNKVPEKRSSDFLDAAAPPMPGCLAIYKDIDSPPNKAAGHVTLVVAVNGNSISTVEGNSSPIPGSTERGVYAKFEARPWGKDSQYLSDNQHRMVYQGCAMPWPGDSVVFSNQVCTQGAADSRLKPPPATPDSLYDAEVTTDPYGLNDKSGAGSAIQR